MESGRRDARGGFVAPWEPACFLAFFFTNSVYAPDRANYSLVSVQACKSFNASAGRISPAPCRRFGSPEMGRQEPTSAA